MPSRAAAYLRLTGLSLALKFWTVARTQRAFYGRDGLWPADDASRAERRVERLRAEMSGSPVAKQESAGRA